MQLSKPSTKPTSATTMNLSTASMIDVVFLLLIFFLVTTTFRIPTQSLATPIVAQAVSPDRLETNAMEPVILTMRSQSGVVEYELGSVKTDDVREIKNVLQSMETKTAPMVVKVGDGIPFQSATTLIALCRSCGHESVAWFPNHDR